jgi:tetratricopeptide (TPR) repeat protein
LRITKDPWWFDEQKFDPRTQDQIHALLSGWDLPHLEPLSAPTTDNRNAVADFIVNAELWAPSSSVIDLKRRVDVFIASGAALPAFEDLVADGVFVAVGQRTVHRFRKNMSLPESLRRILPEWVFTRELLPGEKTKYLTDFLKTRFRTVEIVGLRVFACNPSLVAGPELQEILARLSFGTEAVALDAWKRLVALDLELVVGRWVPYFAADRLARLVSAELLSDGGEAIAWRTDLRLWAFHEGIEHNPIDSVRIPETGGLCAALLAFEHLSDQWHKPIGHDHLEDLATSLADLPFAAGLRDSLAKWPVGHCLSQLLSTLSHRNPRHLALLFHRPETSNLAAVAIHALPSRVRANHASEVVLADEWLEVEALTRDLLVRGQWAPMTHDAALDLGERDEAAESDGSLNRRDDGLRSLSLERRMAPWQWWNRRAGSDLGGLSNRLIERLRVEPSVPRIALSLRFVSELAPLAAAAADRLADELLASYWVDSREHPIADLSRLGGLMRGIFTLPSWNQARMEALLWPEPLGASLDAINAESDPDHHRFFLVMHSAETHVRNVVGMASVATEDEFAAICGTVLKVRKEMNAVHRSWNWSMLSGEFWSQREPFLVILGQALVRYPNEGLRFVRRLKASDPQALELAQLLQGVGLGTELSDALLELLPDLVDKLIQEGTEVCIGHLQALMQSLASAELWDQIDACRKELDGILERRDRSPTLNEYRQVAFRARFVVHFHRREFEKILQIEPESRDPDTLSLVYAYHGIARAELNDPEAEANLREALRANPRNVLALINLPVVLMRREEWERALQEINEARKSLGAQSPERLDLLEAHCRYHQGRSSEAMEIVRRLSHEVRISPEALMLRYSFMIDHSPDLEGFRDDLNAIRRASPELVGLLEERMAPLATFELAGPWISPGKPRAIGFEDLCRFAGDRDPEKKLVETVSRAALSLARLPALARKLDEDDTTDLVAVMLNGWLGHYRVQARTRSQGGHGPVRGGVPDLVLEPMAAGNRRLLVAEAKKWTGPAQLTKSLGQLFGVANTNEELVRLVLLYCYKAKFTTAIEQVRSGLKSYRQHQSDGDAFVVERVDEIGDNSLAVRVFKSLHRLSDCSPEAKVTIPVHTILVDLGTERARASRFQTLSRRARADGRKDL